MATIKDLKRMCEFYQDCRGCPFYSTCCGGCKADFPENADEIVDKWILEHPVRTYAMDFFEKFPNAKRNKNGLPLSRGCIICIKELYDNELPCRHCFDCWNQEIKEKKQ